jgi:single-strand DNA-binding protein
VFLIGNVVEEKPEIHKPKSGKSAWADVTLAVNRSNQTDEADFIRCRLFGKLAEGATKLERGSLVFVEGRLELNKYKTKSGDPAIAARVLLSYIQLIARQAQAGVDNGSTA